MSQNMELEACPFCGNSAVVLRTNTHAGMSWVACDSCGLEAPTETGVSAEDAVTYWNRRALTATHPDTGDLVSRLQVQLNAISGASNIAYNLKQVKPPGDAQQMFARISEALDAAMPVLREAADFISRLSTAPAGDVVVKPLEQMPSREWLRDKIKGDPDDAEVEVRPPGAYAPAPTPSPQTSPATEGELVHVDGVTMTPTAAANRIAELEAERDKLREAADNAMNAYVDALVKREHGGIAASIFLAEIAVALGRNPTAEMDAKRREALKAAQ